MGELLKYFMVEAGTRESVELIEMDCATLKNNLRKALTNPYIILLALLVLVSANSLKNDFLNLDDQGFIVHNPHMNLSLNRIPSIFTKTLQAGFIKKTSYYRPLLELLYICNYKIWGPNPVGFHLVNLLLHFLCAIFLYKTGLILSTGDKNITLLAASLWVVHPVNNEPLLRVAMNENIYGFFVITSVYSFIRGRKYLSWFTFASALLSKESAVMLPFVLGLFSIHKNGLRKGIASMRSYAIILVVYLVIRQIIVGSFWGLDFPQSLFVRVITMAAASFDYTRLMIMPYPLHTFYPARLYSSVLEPKVMGAITTLMLVTYFAFKLRRDKIMLFILLSPFIFLAPAIAKVNAFPIAIEFGYIAERLLYVPAMFFSLFISALVFRGVTTETEKLCKVAGLAAIIIIFALITVSSCKQWENDTSFYRKLAEDAPDSSVTHYHRGTVLFDQGKLNDAYVEFKAAFFPNQGLFKEVKRQLDSSENRVLKNNKPFDLNILREYQPAFAEIHFAFGCIFFEQGDIDKAIRKFKVSLVLQPHFTKAHYYLGRSYLKKGQLDKARIEFQTFLKNREAEGDAFIL